MIAASATLLEMTAPGAPFGPSGIARAEPAFAQAPPPLAALLGAINLVATAVLLLVLMRWGGSPAATMLGAGIGAALLLGPLLLPFSLEWTGFPIPLFASAFELLPSTLWGNAMACAAAAAALRRWRAGGLRIDARVVMVAFVAAVALQAALTSFTALYPGPREAFGSPLAVGETTGLEEFGGVVQAGARANVALLLDNLLITTAGFVVLGSRFGLSAGAAAAIGALLFAFVTMLLYVGTRSGSPLGLPFPIAASARGRVDLAILFVDAAAGAVLFAVAWRRLSVLRDRARQRRAV